MIINSVVVGGSGGDEVEAYALGDAKNAVKDDKVTLNFSANMATLEPSLSRGPSGSPYYPGAVSLVVGKYLYALNTVSSSATVVRWEKSSDGNFVNGFSTALGSGRNTSTKPIGPGVRLSYYGKIHQFTEFGKVFDVTTSGSTDSGYVCASMSQDGNVIMAQYPSNLAPILLTKESGLFIKSSVLNNPNGVEGFWAFTGKKEGSKYYAYVTGRGNTGLKYVCLDVATSTIELLSLHTVQTISEYCKSPVCFKNKLICYNSGNSNKAEVYTFTDDGSLTFSEEDSSSLRAVVSRNSLTEKVGFVQDGYLICSNDIVGYNQTRIDYKEGTGFFEVASPFQDKEGGNVNYTGEGYAIWCNMTTLPEAFGNSFIRRYVSPVEQSYVAAEPITGQFYANQTLTGIVKENNNGVLKVSTVEDPNNPPPAIPDEAGLNTVINYGSATKKLVNGEVEGSLTVSDDASVSGFTSSDSNLVYIDNPFLQILEGSEPVINTFEIVIPFTKGTSSDDWLFAFGNSIPASGEDITNCFYVNVNNRLDFYFSSPNLAMPGTTTLTSNTKYWIKLAYDETEGYKILLSTNGSDYTVEASSATTTELDVGNYNYLIFGNCTSSTSTSYNWSGIIHFDGAYVNINGRQYWKGSKPDFGSVSVGYGYFLNPQYKGPDWWSEVGKTKYLSYDGGMLTEDDIQGRKATTMNIILARNADMGSWTSDTEGFLSAQDAVVLGLNKKLSTPVYLWHDLSYISPIVPETIEPEITLGDRNTIKLLDFNTTGVSVDSQANVAGFDGGGRYMAYIDSPIYNKTFTNSNINIQFAFTTGTTVTSYERMICGFYNSVSSGDVNGFFLKKNTSGQLCFGNGTSSGTYLATDTTALSASTRYRVNINFSTATNTITVYLYDSDDKYLRSFEASTTLNTSAPYLVFGCNVNANYNNYNWNGSIAFANYRMWGPDFERYFALPDIGGVALKPCWKNIDGVLYEYPNGFPKTEAGTITVKYPRLNADVIGSPAVSTLSGDVSGFTTRDYLRVPYKYWKEDLSTPGSGFDIDIAFSVDAQVSPGQYVLGGSTNNAPITLGFTSAGNMEVDVYCTAETTKTFRMSYTGAIEVGNRYVFRIGYNTFTGYYVTRSTNNGEPETLVTNSTTTPPYMYSPSELWLGRAAYDLIATGLVVHLPECAIYVNGEKKWEGLDPDTTMGEPALYVTKTGDRCSLAISRKAPKGVDSSAVIGTLELDANGAIISYSPIAD